MKLTLLSNENIFSSFQGNQICLRRESRTSGIIEGGHVVTRHRVWWWLLLLLPGGSWIEIASLIVSIVVGHGWRANIVVFWWVLAIVCSRVAHRLTLLPHSFLLQDGLFSCDSELVVVEELSSKEECKFWIVTLLVFCHMFEFGPIPCDELGQFVDYVPQFYFYISNQKLF